MSMLDPKAALAEITDNMKPCKEITEFSDKTGIYGITYLGGRVPLICGNIQVERNTLLYVGKTESSQIERDAKEHFATGKTGHSTLRRSIGALLLDELNLKPQPRSNTQTSARKYINYKFDDEGEARLTEWMLSHLGIGFYECDKSEIKALEKALIKLAVPALNIQGNLSSPFYNELDLARAKCKEQARNNDVLTG